VPPGNHRGSDLRRTCQYAARFETRGRPVSGCAKRGGAGGRDGLRRKAHPEPLPSLDDRSDPQAFHHNPAQRPSLALHYQGRDYAPLQSRPPFPCSLIAAGSRSHSLPPHRAYSSERRTARSAAVASVSCIMRARCQRVIWWAVEVTRGGATRQWVAWRRQSISAFESPGA
jgi:hypothetical protein